MQGQPKFSLAGTEVGFILENYDSIQDIATAVEAVVKRYPKDSVMLANVLSDYRQNADEEEFIQGLRTFAKYFGDKQERDRSEDKATIEETFGGIWIEDTQEFTKFVSAVNTYPKDRNGDGIAFTDNFFYAYYLNTSNDAIPYVEVDLNGIDSQKYVEKIIKYGENRTAREWANWFNENIRNGQYKNNGINIGNQTTSTARADGRVDSKLPRLGRYYYTPELYSKVKRTDRESTGRGKVAYSLITPEMDASYLDAVERGDIILLKGGMLITSGDAHRSTMHEYTHSITKKYLGERLAEVTASIPKEDISKASNELLCKAYDKETPQIIIDEFVSYLIKSLSMAKTNDIFVGELGVEEYIETLRDEIAQKNIESKDVLYAVLPLVKENLHYKESNMEQKKKTPSFSRDINIVDYLLMRKKQGTYYGELKRKSNDPSKQNPEFMKLVEEAKARRKK